MSWEALERVIARRVLDDALRVSGKLAELGIPHALVGGLAVGLHGHPRATKDVDFIVGAEAFASTLPLLTFREELAGIARWGVVDLIAALPGDPVLCADLARGEPGRVPVVGVEVLVVMKLRASRSQDLADVEALVKAGADVAAILDFIKTYESKHVAAFARIAQRALLA